MIGINGLEALILGLLVVLILGPDKLPSYASNLATLVRNLRALATGAKNQLTEELGDEIADIDWRTLDPRRYDPRTIIKDALLEDLPGDISAAPVAASASPVPHQTPHTTLQHPTKGLPS
ncbi:Sec-independent protein translocase TatB [Arthrobacter sp. Soc17.1.1.1]|uniref:Sec-independent protein translocase TatB n=1 Tax=Arthrobacter sp. Soc17.1.1.1 TaxID=3121277 RepID=UPI002FE4C5A5